MGAALLGLLQIILFLSLCIIGIGILAFMFLLIIQILKAILIAFERRDK